METTLFSLSDWILLTGIKKLRSADRTFLYYLQQNVTSKYIIMILKKILERERININIANL